MSNPPLRAPLLILAAMTILGAAACGKRPQGRPPGGPPEVGVVVVRTGAASLQVELPGRTAAIETSEVRPQVSGIIQRRLFTEGGVVRAGQPLYQIDPAPFRAALGQAQGQLAAAQAGLTTGRLKAERYADLVKINAVSRQEADDAEAAFEQARASVQQAKAAVDVARINLGYTLVRAPIRGHIGRSSVTPGALVTAQQAAPLATIQRTDLIYVDLAQSAGQMLAMKRSLKDGRLGHAGQEVRLVLDDGSLYEAPGRLQFAEVGVDPATGTVALRAIFPNRQDFLLPGLFVRARINQGTEANAILAPQRAVGRDDRGQATALVVNDKGVAELRTLTTTRAEGADWIVTSGLTPGDRLIVEGVQKAKPGMKVRAVPAGSPPSAGPPGGRPGRAP